MKHKTREEALKELNENVYMKDIDVSEISLEVINGWFEGALEITIDLMENQPSKDDDNYCKWSAITNEEECYKELVHTCYEHYRDGEYE